MGAIVTVAASCRDTSVDVSVSVKLAHFCEALHQPGNPSLPPNTSYEPEQRGHCAAGRERAGSLYQANSSNAGAPFQRKVIPQACPWRGSDEKKVRTWMVLGVVEEVYCGYKGEDSHRDLSGRVQTGQGHERRPVDGSERGSKENTWNPETKRRTKSQENM